MLNPAIVTAAVTITVALLGFLATYANSVRLNQRQARLERINRQLSELYGPMLAIRGANLRAFEEFSKIYDFDNGRFHGGPPTEEDHEAWRLWVTTVFAVENQRLYKILLTKADLLIDDEMPAVLLDYCAHVLGYEVVLKEWEKGDYRHLGSVIIFPKRLDEYAKQCFSVLKEEQARLIGGQSLREKLALRT
jgi:hypothetical protein